MGAGRRLRAVQTGRTQRETKPCHKPLKNVTPDGKTTGEPLSPALSPGDWSPSSAILRRAAATLNMM
jgi:hypothetical protein